MQNYLNAIADTMKNGDTINNDRTGTGTTSLFGGVNLEFDLSTGTLPIVTTKRTFLKGVIHELLWFISGSTNIKYLQSHNINFWNEWADKDGSIGAGYGKQWRAWEGKDGETIDQLALAIQTLKTTPASRRIIVSDWNVADIEDMNLPCCHGNIIQFNTSKGALNLKMYQRSADLFLGLPFNITSYALLLAMVADVAGLKRGKLFISVGDAHLYSNHKNQALELLTRQPLPLPVLKFSKHHKNIDEFDYNSFIVEDYQHLGAINAPVSV